MYVSGTNINDYKKNFRKKFNNFAKRSPVKLSYVLTDNFCLVKLLNEDISEKFEINYMESPNFLIKEIRDHILVHYYPRMVKVEELKVKRSYQEVSDLMDNHNLSLDEVDLYKISNNKLYFIIEKVNYKKDTMIIRSCEDSSLTLHKLTMPVILFLNKVYKVWNEEEIYTNFILNSKVLKEHLQDKLGVPEGV